MGGSYEVPDWKEYKVGPNTPELQNLEKRLAEKGLKDPWIRNYVWRYDRRYNATPSQKWYGALKRGFVPGLVAALISTALTKYFESQDPRSHAAHGGDHH